MALFTEEARADIAARFEKYVIRPDEPDACWQWAGPINRCGYGVVWYQGKAIGAHRIAYELFKDSIPQGLHVMHACSAPACVNPLHLACGTAGDTARHRDKKGRGAYKPGEGHPDHSLTNAQAREVRELYATGRYLQVELVARFGVKRSTIGNILRGDGYRLAGGPTVRIGRGRRAPLGLTDARVVEMRELFATGQYRQSDLAARFDTTRTAVSHIVRGDTRPSAGGPFTRVGRGRGIRASRHRKDAPA